MLTSTLCISDKKLVRKCQYSTMDTAKNYEVSKLYIRSDTIEDYFQKTVMCTFPHNL